MLWLYKSLLQVAITSHIVCSLSGSVKVNVAPFEPRLFCAQILPPCISTIFLAIYSPNPAPESDLLEKSNQMLNDAIKLVVPQENSTLNLIVASWLLDVANTEYQAGVNEGKVLEIIEYQDASGFISRAESLVKDSLPMLDQSMKGSAEEILNLISPLKSEVQNRAYIQIPIDELKQKISNMTGI